MVPEALVTLDQLGAPELLSPDKVFAQVLDFYALPVGIDTTSHEAHAEISLQLGRQMDAMFIRDEVLPRLANGERVELVQAIPLRAALWLIDQDPETNLFKRLERATDKFQITYLPLGVTRHEEPGMEIRFHRYYPAGERGLLQQVPDVENKKLLRSVDFGGASGISLAETTKLIQAELGITPEDTFVDAVISSDHAQRVYSAVMPMENAHRLLIGEVNQDFWIIGGGPQHNAMFRWSEFGYGPKDWGYVATGMEDPTLFGITCDRETFLVQYKQDSERFFGALQRVAALNENFLPRAALENGGYDELARWYRRRFLSANAA